MMAFVRLAVMGLIVMTVFYVLIGIYVRSLRRERLEEMWEEQGGHGDRDAFVRAGMEAYNKSLRPRLLIFVYIIPTILFVATIYFTNYQ
jgi:hypothetical protein